jgi:hypothetical protein
MKKLTKKQLLLQAETKHLLIFGCGVMVVCLVTWYMLAQAATPAQPQRLVTFYDRGIERVVLTQSATAGDALRFAGISIDPNDIIEPSVDTKLSNKNEEIIIYRSRMISVVDGSIRQTVMTARQSPHEILNEAGLPALDTKDTSTFQRATSAIGGALTELVVSRVEPEPQKAPQLSFQPKPNALTRSRGAHVYVDGDGVAHRETYYDLPMNGTLGNCGPGNSYTIRSDGAKIDQDGYVLIAANFAAYPRCTIVDTSLGLGKVYDTGGFALHHPYGFDLATDWSNGDGI